MTLLSIWSEVQMNCICSSACHCHPIISCFIKMADCFNASLPRCPGKEVIKQVSVLYGTMQKSAVKSYKRDCGSTYNCPKWCAQLRRHLEQQRSAVCRASVWGISTDRRRFNRLRSVARRAAVCSTVSQLRRRRSRSHFAARRAAVVSARQHLERLRFTASSRSLVPVELSTRSPSRNCAARSMLNSLTQIQRQRRSSQRPTPNLQL